MEPCKLCNQTSCECELKLSCVPLVIEELEWIERNILVSLKIPIEYFKDQVRWSIN